MDDADCADAPIEADLERCVAAATGGAPTPRPTCCDCADDLEAHRPPYGICIPCQTRRERALSRRLRWS